MQLRLSSFPPEITVQPQEQVVAEGENATFTVGVASELPVSYQWRFNGADLPTETDARLVLANVTTNQLGLYSVVVSSSAGAVISDSAALKFTDVIKGQVTDALTGAPLAGVTVWVGSLTNITDSSGHYQIVGADPGGIKAEFDANVRTGLAPLTVNFASQIKTNSATLHAEINGYVPYTNNVVEVSAGQIVTNTFSMSPLLSPGTIRFVLNWQAEPYDIDAHLVTPVIQGQSYHIFYPPRNRGNLIDYPFAALDIDRTNGFGPETITVRQSFPGTYQFYVSRFAGASRLAGSDATVKVYTEAGLIRTFKVPTTGFGDFWHVCNFEGATRDVVAVNQILIGAPASLHPGQARACSACMETLPRHEQL